MPYALCDSDPRKEEQAMPMPFHTEIIGKNQGSISDGASKIEGREGTILCQALNHEVYIPRDPQTGQPTGKRIHNPYTITKSYDKSSPKLYQALVTGEQMDNVTSKFYRISETGTEEHYFTIKLTNAIIVSIKPWIANALDKSKESFTHMEDVSFTYQDIVWTWEIDGVEAQDSWLKPK
jgi:type VI secretion system secreted protein Hcp